MPFIEDFERGREKTLQKSPFLVAMANEELKN